MKAAMTKTLNLYIISSVRNHRTISNTEFDSNN